MTPALHVDAATLRPQGGPPALHDVRLRVAPGERVALLGGNGAGKTTLLRAAVGLAAVEGSVHVLGTPVRSPEDAVGAGATLALQNPEDQILGGTVLEDVMIGPRHAGMPLDAARARAREALAAAGIAALEDRAIERLSFGEKRRAGLAAVLAMSPRLLLLDEPTAGLDPAGEVELAAVLARLARERGTAVVVATHAIDLVPLLADRAVVLGEGRVLADGRVAAVLADVPLLVRARLRAPRALEAVTRGEGPLHSCAPVEVPSWNVVRS
jgi:cobalt/nickel transport system ATP-binding protein